jgi:hypothetical protein
MILSHHAEASYPGSTGPTTPLDRAENRATRYPSAVKPRISCAASSGTSSCGQ